MKHLGLVVIGIVVAVILLLIAVGTLFAPKDEGVESDNIQGATTSAETGVQLALAEKYNLNPAEISVSIEKQIDSFTAGTARFLSQSGVDRWVAVQQGEFWIIIDDGAGALSCVDLDLYAVPVALVSECVTTSDVLVTR